jgi:hypothetical protein
LKNLSFCFLGIGYWFKNPMLPQKTEFNSQYFEKNYWWSIYSSRGKWTIWNAISHSIYDPQSFWNSELKKIIFCYLNTEHWLLYILQQIFKPKFFTTLRKRSLYNIFTEVYKYKAIMNLDIMSVYKNVKKMSIHHKKTEFIIYFITCNYYTDNKIIIWKLSKKKHYYNKAIKCMINLNFNNKLI